LNDINYKFFYWGPFLLQTKIDEELRNDLLQESKKAVSFFDHNLSKLDDEHSFRNDQIESFSKRLNVYLDTYKDAYQKHWNCGHINEIKIKSMWVNNQKEKEWRPPHFHSNCDASFVIYLDMPKVESMTEDVYYEYIPGGIVFKNATKAQFHDKLKSIDHISYLPENGDMFIFPYNLEHYSVPFKTEATRVSLSGNLIIK
jgi:uncharacterized protein (TIGR02466 family)